MPRKHAAPVEISTFMKRHWQRKPLLVRGAFPGFVDPLSPREILRFAGSTDVGGFIEFIAATGMLLQPLKRLTGVNEHVQRGLAACESVFGLIDEAPEEDRGKRAFERARGAVRFEDVTLTYRSAASPASQRRRSSARAAQSG